ncbi:MAG: carbon monoxide dehydrogenase, partial [Candidatus Eisenbacteria bacterium]
MIGSSPTRTDGASKVTGRALYIDDVPFAGLLYGKTIRTTVARGRLLGVTFKPGVPWDEFTIVTAKDIPGLNTVTLIESDQPYLAHDVIRHAAEPVVLIAHPDKGLVEKAATLVELEVEPLPAVFTI